MTVSKYLTIQVRQRDIDAGVPEDGATCAISHAVARLKHKSPDSLSLNTTLSRVSIGSYNYVPRTNRDLIKMERFIENFDDDSRRRYCRPTTIRLKLEEESEW